LLYGEKSLINKNVMARWANNNRQNFETFSKPFVSFATNVQNYTQTKLIFSII